MGEMSFLVKTGACGNNPRLYLTELNSRSKGPFSLFRSSPWVMQVQMRCGGALGKPRTAQQRNAVK